MKKHLIALLTLTSLVLTACGDGDDGGSTDGKIAGDITVLTQRTDIVDTVLQDYKKKFEAKYPGTTRQVRGDHRLRGRGPRSG